MNKQEVKQACLQYIAQTHKDDESLISMRRRHEQEFINYLEQFLPKEMKDEKTDS